MNYDEFAFFNQQLAAMLRDGLSLEDALKGLAADLKAKDLRAEIARLQSDLEKGVPLHEAMAARKLPELYRCMVGIGARGNDLPGVLLLIADYYHRGNALWNRLKGLMVYPFIVVLVSLGLTITLSAVLGHFMGEFYREFGKLPLDAVARVWAPPALMAIFAIVGFLLVAVPKWRARLRWRLPAFREASLAQLASVMTLLLKTGTPLPDALVLAQGMEAGSPAGRALARWRALIESGQGKPESWPKAIKPFPPLFLWLVRKGGEDLADGFQKAADFFQSRASYKIELALYAALPVSILLLGQMIFWQIEPMYRGLIAAMNLLGS